MSEPEQNENEPIVLERPEERRVWLAAYEGSCRIGIAPKYAIAAADRAVCAYRSRAGVGSSSGDKWEYLVRDWGDYVLGETQSLTEYMNKHAVDGWELFVVDRSEETYRWYFRRSIARTLTESEPTSRFPK
jgi:hypothetical protein